MLKTDISHWLPQYGKIWKSVAISNGSFLLFNWRKKFKQVWNNNKVRKWRQIILFGVNCLFNSIWRSEIILWLSLKHLDIFYIRHNSYRWSVLNPFSFLHHKDQVWDLVRCLVHKTYLFYYYFGNSKKKVKIMLKITNGKSKISVFSWSTFA